MLKTKLLGATAAAGELLAIEDVFSTWLYTGNGSTQTITNGIDLAGEGGLVWGKERGPGTGNNFLFDTERGAGVYLRSNLTNAQFTDINTLSSFNSNGFSLGSNAVLNNSTDSFVSWTFRKAPRFFDVVTYTGNGTANRAIAHNLGTTVGSIFIKRTDTTRNWAVYHRSTTAYDYSLRLNTTDAQFQDNYFSAAPDASNFYIDKSPGGDLNVNASGGTYVAYLFAHDPLGPSGDGSDGLIACGSYTGNTTTKPNINLGWEPQWVLIKAASGTNAGTQNWALFDSMRGFTMGDDARLQPNTSDAEASYDDINPTSTGFTIGTGGNRVNENGSTYIYIAIRRGPMREPTSGTEVFAVDQGDSTTTNPQFVSNFTVDLGIWRNIGAGNNWETASRITGQKYLRTNSTDAELGPDADIDWDFMTGFYGPARNTSFYSWMFRRAPGFFDVVAYAGDGAAGRTVPHNLGVAPELMIVKNRGDVRDWIVYHKDLGATYLAELNTTAAAYQNSSYWPSVPTDSVFSPGNASATNRSGYAHIAYLFATIPGISKVGSYTGNGSSQTINCGFTGGARFILIKRTDSTGDWYVWDTARGIVSGNDPHLSLNTTAAQVTSDDTIDPDSSGFIVNQVSATNVNVSSASYIFLAVS